MSQASKNIVYYLLFDVTPPKIFVKVSICLVTSQIDKVWATMGFTPNFLSSSSLLGTHILTLKS